MPGTPLAQTPEHVGGSRRPHLTISGLFRARVRQGSEHHRRGRPRGRCSSAVPQPAQIGRSSAAGAGRASSSSWRTTRRSRPARWSTPWRSSSSAHRLRCCTAKSRSALIGAGCGARWGACSCWWEGPFWPVGAPGARSWALGVGGKVSSGGDSAYPLRYWPGGPRGASPWPLRCLVRSSADRSAMSSQCDVQAAGRFEQGVRGDAGCAAVAGPPSEVVEAGLERIDGFDGR